MVLNVGSRIGQYEVTALIGKGGMGAVYLAERADGQFRKKVAVKLITGGLETPEMERRFRAERQILADIEHPGIARLLDGGVTDEGHPYLVMEFVEGRTLAEEMAAGPVSLTRFFDIAIPLADTLAVAHGRGVVHRDLKPDNVMLTLSGFPKVLDFGVAKRRQPPLQLVDDAPTETLAELTQEGGIVGTVPYMSPEQVRGRDVDERTDLFSLGVILYELLVGTRPFTGESAVDLISSILKEQPPDPETLRSDVPPPLAVLVRHCLVKNAEDRMPSATELRDRLSDLQKTVRSSSISDAEAGPASPPTGGELRLDRRAVAVLPFENLSGTEDAGLLGAGLHSDLITELSKIPGLTVISRSSVMSIAQRRAGKAALQIGQELGVGTLVEGTVQSAGNRVRLTAQLVNAIVDTQIWAERYDRQLSTETLFSIQSELSRRIVDSLHSQLAVGQVIPVGRRQTNDLEAYRLCSMGRMHFDRKTESGFLRSIEHFEEAVKRDPDYVLAWAGLAAALALMEDYGYGDSAALLAKAKKAVDRALELDPDSPEAHTSLGLFYSSIQDGPATLREFELAVQVQPGYANAHNWMGWTSNLVGRAALALECAERAVQLDPLSAEAVSNLALSYLTTGDAERGLGEARRAAELSPGYTTPRLYEGLALYHEERYEEARSVLAGLTVEWAGLGAEATLVLSYLFSGGETAAREALRRVDLSADPFAVGIVHLALGEVDMAFESFSKAGRLREWPTFAIHYFYGDVWDKVRHDPRYQDLVRLSYTSWKVDPTQERTNG